MRTTGLVAAAIAGALLAGACGKGDGKPAAPAVPPAGASGVSPAAEPAAPSTSEPGSGNAKPGAPRGDRAPETNAAEDDRIAKYGKDLDIPMVKYEWDRNAGDKSVPAELGGPGFTGEGWTTRLEFPALGDPASRKGGTLRNYLPDWPQTLRQSGENWNQSFNYNVNELCNETLTISHPVTLETCPSLATHWKISADRQTYTFRINPEARFSDGSEVTAQDVVANWKFRMDETLRFPSNIVVYEKFDPPVAKSKYIVEVHCNQDNWRNFLYFGGMPILHSAATSLKGSDYLDRFQNAYPPNSGGYTVRAEDIKMGQSIAITRRTDWWGEKNPAWVGTGNIDRFEFEVIKDENLAFEKAKKGELDVFVVNKAQWWAEEIPKLDPVKRGHLVMKKIYNDQPIGTMGIAINMKKAPLDDLRIRKALQLLFNRKLYNEKLFFNEYDPITSYEYGVWANPSNKPYEFDLFGAVELLEEAGWKEVNSELYRIKGGRVLKFEVIYRSPLSERSLTIYQEDCKKAGIKLELKLLTPATFWDTMTQKQYELAFTNWGALVFPNPETSWKSELADQVSNNNVTAFKNAKVDALLGEYDRAYEVKDRIRVLHEIDAILYAEMPYVLGWYLPSIRFLYWNKISMPPWGTTRVHDSNDPFWASFWIDPDKERALAAARKSGASLPLEERENRFWPAYGVKERRQAGGGK